MSDKLQLVAVVIRRKLQTSDRRTSCFEWRLRLVTNWGDTQEIKNPAPQSARGSNDDLDNPHSSLAVFYVEQVALNRHDQ